MIGGVDLRLSLARRVSTTRQWKRPLGCFKASDHTRVREHLFRLVSERLAPGLPVRPIAGACREELTWACRCVAAACRSSA
jgi:hypothetical protein